MHQRSQLHYPHVFRVFTTLQTWKPSPSGPSVDNHPEPVVHPRMNSRSEQYTLHFVRPPLTLRCHVLYMYCYYCRVFIVSPPSSYCLVTPRLPSPTLLCLTTSSTTVPLPASFQASRAIFFP